MAESGEKNQGTPWMTILLIVIFLVVTAVGSVLALGGLLITVFIGLGILRFTGPASQFLGKSDSGGLDFIATVTQMGVGIFFTVVGVAMLAFVVWVLVRSTQVKSALMQAPVVEAAAVSLLSLTSSLTHSNR